MAGIPQDLAVVHPDGYVPPAQVPGPVVIQLNPARSVSSARLDFEPVVAVTGHKVATGALSVSAGITHTVTGHKVEASPFADRRPLIAWCLGWAIPGGSVGEHALHGPWLLRWGFGVALGAAFGAWIWDALRPR